MVDLNKLYQELSNNLGQSGWWPADSKEEIILGAILVQNTNWNNADLALTELKRRTGLDPQNILNLTQEELMRIIKSSGFYKNKSRAILATFEWLDKEGWDYEAISDRYGSKLRSELLKIPGVGNETADVFQVYIFDRPVLIADSYTRRLFAKLGYTKTKTYEELWKQVKLPSNFTYLDAQEFHGLIDNFGKEYLRYDGLFEKSFLAGMK
ncbi:endonuclease III domain-containing protein [Lentilactobacillus sp. SPB1-3]|uniref:Endonuclease III domain-containing protein n=1 Tax=Lentilactobacillus terminaliae TaxID=3003483 RepID=A0ACD5DEG1_9LACO|nr:deoxyribonuclease I [Lentilactobacillus sp. SPB1-3]MCZ0976292.1 deoxyribonuclease I [Lentilactobacillus sp. SPB1-3]